MNGEFWDEKYASESFGYGTAPNAFLASQAAHLRGLSSAFVPGDGTGRNGVWLATQGLAVHTVDLSPVGVAAARALADTRGVAIDAQVADLADYAWPEAPVWDVVVAIWLHLPPPLRPVVHAQLWAGLKPGGLILLEAYRPEHAAFRERYGSVGGPPIGPMMTQTQLRAEFPDGDFELLEDADVVLDEGTGHQGRSATVRARIRK